MSKKISALTIEETYDQLQILEYVANHTAEGLSDGDHIYLRKLQKHEERLRMKAGAT